MAETVDPNDFFNIDKVGEEPEQPKDNIFGEFEHHLNLPMGSTQEALDSAKTLIAQTKALTAQAQMVTFDESKFDDIQADDINDDMLRKDRARIRKEAHELYDMGKNMLKYMYDQVKSQVDPGDKMWASVANMISSVTNSLNNLNKMTKDLREETEHDTEKRILAGEITDNDAQEYDMSPQQANKLIAAWAAESEAKVQEELKAMADENERKAIENHSQETEQKLLGNENH
jgi:hypothetical protein